MTTRKSLPPFLRSRGALTVTDLTCHIAGEQIRGSWWGHPKAHEIYRALGKLLDHQRRLLL